MPGLSYDRSFVNLHQYLKGHPSSSLLSPLLPHVPPITEEFNIGDIVHCPWLTTDGREIPHYGLVVGVDNKTDEIVLVVAYATSKRVSVSARLDHELILASKEDLDSAGLRAATRIDLNSIQRIDAVNCEKVGALRLDNREIRSCFYAAVKASNLKLQLQ
jgi:hypothetical protein